ncbi:MAG: hypothetical protein IT367_08070 [Candidatus Hydrogenedentes bacterium]|nr:hypothetical protein [Candidatus Hydrogenedentota bacterium]
MLKPLGVLLALVFLAVLLLYMLFALWWMVRAFNRGYRKTSITLAFTSMAIAVFCAFALHALAPKGGQTIAQLQLPDNREIIVRLYRYGWFEYPRARFYASDQNGVWTSFVIISELVNARKPSLTFDATKQEVTLDSAGWYRIDFNDFVNIDGGRGKAWQLAPGVDPRTEQLNGITANPTSVLIRQGE